MKDYPNNATEISNNMSIKPNFYFPIVFPWKSKTLSLPRRKYYLNWAHLNWGGISDRVLGTGSITYFSFFISLQERNINVGWNKKTPTPDIKYPIPPNPAKPEPNWILTIEYWILNICGIAPLCHSLKIANLLLHKSCANMMWFEQIVTNPDKRVGLSVIGYWLLVIGYFGSTDNK